MFYGVLILYTAQSLMVNEKAIHDFFIISHILNIVTIIKKENFVSVSYIILNEYFY